MSKDQVLGSIILVACIVAALGFTGLVIAPEMMKGLIPWLPGTASQIQFGAVATVVLLAFLAVMFIGAWIGWTMATTPPPKPLEETETSEESASVETEKSKE